jgi:hypothetical protein
LALICAAQFVLQLDLSIVNIALPSIQAELHVTTPSPTAVLAPPMVRWSPATGCHSSWRSGLSL